MSIRTTLQVLLVLIAWPLYVGPLYVGPLYCEPLNGEPLNGEPLNGGTEGGCAVHFVEPLEHARQHLAASEPKAARASLDAARAALTTVDCAAARLRVDLLEGQLWLEEGRLTDADALLRALPRGGSMDADLEAEYTYLAGTLAYQLGQYRRARSHYQRLLAIDQDLGSLRHQAEDRYLIAATYVGEAVGEEDRPQAIARFRTALAASATGGRAETVARMHLELGKLIGGSEGQAHLHRALALAQAPESLATALGGLAVERLADDPAAAQRLLERALGLAEQALAEEGNLWPLIYLWNDRFTVAWATLPAAAALDSSLASLRHIETLRRQQQDRAVRAGVFSVWTEAYQWLAGRLLASAGSAPAGASVDRAFGIMERYRSRVLADSLAAAGAASATAASATVPGEERVASLAEIQASLAADEALLAFQIAPWKDVYGRFAGGSWLLAVSRGSARAYRLPGRGPIERQVRLYLGVLAQRIPEGEAAARLYRDLLAAAVGDLPGDITKLILVPDGELHLLPFATLRAASESLPLAAHYQLSVVPSASLWKHWRQAASPVLSSSALVIANPLPRGTSAAPLRAVLGPLPFAAAEGRAVVERVGGGSRLRLAEEATEAFLKEHDLKPFGLLHFAAHAVVDDVHPERSAVLLAPSGDEDGELRAREIVQLDLAGRLIVLSACQSASGSVLRGEGVMSLARAFFQAGASTVLGSLWPLDDREAQLFFEAFYRHLATGTSVRAALQRAQNELHLAGAPAAAWGGVVVLGDSARVPLPSGSGAWLVVGLLALGMVGLVLVRRRRCHASVGAPPAAVRVDGARQAVEQALGDGSRGSTHSP